MSDVIHLLPDAVANQIAAGEVIQRPASVLKELVENALDAGATEIIVVIRDSGRTLIQVTDNGKGMSETDARMAFERHATSKITSADDLFSLYTFGFRGEALASIAAVAQVELHTRRKEDELGVNIEIAGSSIAKHENIQCEYGTTFIVKNLFYNVPARRRFLKSDNVEKNHIFAEFYRIVLVNPEVNFTLYDDNQELFRLPATHKKNRIENLFSKTSKNRWYQQLLSVNTQTSLVRISGYVGKPESAQKSAMQFFFVNGRYMRHPYFHKAVMMAYHMMLPTDKNPNYFIYFDIAPEAIDINIHPTKTEIKFENEQAIWSILSATVKESLGKFDTSIDFDREGAIEMPFMTNKNVIEPLPFTFASSYNPFQEESSPTFKTQLKKEEIDWANELYASKKQFQIVTDENFEFNTSEIQHSSNDYLESTINLENTSVPFQYKSKYIFSTIKSGLMIVHQHRAHVRILFDQYLQQLIHHNPSSQQLLFPEVIEFQLEDHSYFQIIHNELTELGFEFNQLNMEGTYEILAIPSRLNPGRTQEFMAEIIEMTKLHHQEWKGKIHEMTALSLAREAAIRVGQRLTAEEMNDIINKLFSSSNCNFTPDGKVILTSITHDVIESKF
jgi:DNA mismatch repair protein MutL